MGIFFLSIFIFSINTAFSQTERTQTSRSGTLDSLSIEKSKQIKVDSTKSSFIQQVQAIGADEFSRSVEKFESRKIYLRQHELITNLKNENFKVKAILNKGINYSEIQVQMREFQALIPFILNGIKENNAELLTERNLTVSAAIFREMLDELVKQKTKVDLFASQIRRSQYVIDSISAEKDLYLFPSDSLQTRQYAFLLTEIAKEIKPIDDSLNSFSGKIDSLQTSLNEMVFDLNTQIEDLEIARQALNASIFDYEIPADPDKLYYSRSLSESISYSFAKEKLALVFYLSLYKTRLIVLLVLILISWTFLHNLKKRTQPSEDLDSDVEEKIVLKFPLLSSIVIVTGFFQFFFPNPPFVFYWILWFIASISLTIIFKGYLIRFWMFFWGFTVLVFLLSGIENMILLPTALERNIMAALASIGVLFLVFTLWKGRNKQLKEQRIVYFIWFMGIFEFISLTMNLLGRFNLSKSFLVAGYIGIVVGILLLWTVRLINQGLSIATKIYHNQEKELFFINFDRLGNRAPGIFYSFLVFGWTILVGKNFYSFSQISLSINQFLNADRMIGSYRFSINGLFVFLIILLVSVLISRLLSIFSADPDPASNTEQRKRISFGSWLLLVQIFVISMGLFLAFAASGIPLDKITIILGALSVGIGLGLQGLVNNLVSGLIIAFENTVKVGDLIEVEGKPGIMKSIGFRSSVVNMFEGSTVVIPNGELISKQLINWTTGKGRKLTVIIGVAYGTDLEKVTRLLREIISEDSRIRIYPPPRVVPVEFSDSSIDFEVTFWVNNYADFPFVKGELLSRANELFKQNEIRIPFPQRDLYLKTVPEELKETSPKKENENQNPNQG
ncbi:MAG TPA: mechanosensitive ion channel domain-containing protein [Algoriphagus sp.]|nr:mechanosensitive ion channel domain-containing protein [Algoriphagus sp.]